MSICTYRYTPTNQKFVTVKCEPSIDLTFTVNALGFLTRTIPPEDLDFYQLHCYSTADTDIPIVQNVRDVFEIHLRNIKLIAEKWQWKGLGDGLSCFHHFTARLESEMFEFVEVDLSNLGLDRVPFPLKVLRQTRKLDLSYNNIRILAIDLQELTALTEIDLRGNPIVELPSWCATEMPHVKILTDLPQCNPEDLTQPELQYL